MGTVILIILLLCSLADLYDGHGDYSGAEVLYKQCLAKMKAVLGKTHPTTLGTMKTIASLYFRQGKYCKAELLLNRCLAKMMVVLGESHPDTEATLLFLSFVERKRSMHN